VTETPAADATPIRKDVCLLEVNSARESGRDTTISTNLVCLFWFGLMHLGLGFGVEEAGLRV